MFWDDPSPALAAHIEQLIEDKSARSRARTDVGRARHDAGGAVHARAHAANRAGPGLFLRSARTLRSQLLWSTEHECHYWTQDMYGRAVSYIDAVHGFVGTASPLIRGRHLFDEREWEEWQRCIENTVRRCATIEDGLANWRARLIPAGPRAQHADAVLPRRAGLCHQPGRHARHCARRSVARRRRSDLARGSAGEGFESLPRHRRQRLRIPETLRTHRRRAVARACARVCDARDQADRSRRRAIRSAALLAVDRRSRVRHLSVGLHPCAGALSDARCVLRATDLH